MPLSLTTLVQYLYFSCDRKKIKCFKCSLISSDSLFTEHLTPDKVIKQTESSETKRYSLVTKVLEEVAQDFEGLDPYTLTL